MKSAYNEHFSFADPLSKTSACRKTRNRAKSMQENQCHSHGNLCASNYVPQMHYESVQEMEIASDSAMPEIDLLETDNEKWLSHIEASTNPESSDTTSDVELEFDKLVLTDNPHSLELDLLVVTADHEDAYTEFDSDEDDKDCELNTESIVDEPNISYDQNEMLYKDASITKAASSVLMIKYAMKHKLSWEALADLLQIVKLHCPSPNNVPSTLFHFKKHFKDMQYPLQHHYFCSTCLSEVSENAKFCGNQECSFSSKELSSLSSFIEVPIDLQMKSILERDEIYHIIYERYHLRKKQDGNYTDVYSGKLYRHHVTTGFLNNWHNISFTLNTDGIPVFRSSNFSFWPLYLMINELPFHMRIAKENLILAGLWYGIIKPDMSLFMKPLTEALKRLYDEGVAITLPDNSMILCRAMLLLTTCDLPARALVLNMVQFNGFYGCCHCLQPGETFRLRERSFTHIYKYIEENPMGPKRKFEETLEHMKTAVSSNSTVFGIKGPSWLCCIPEYNFIKGMSIDYMHCILLGICRLLLRLWMQSTYHQEVWYIGNQLNIVDSRLCNIKPPDEIQRTPRSIELTMKFWKAHELRAWLLHYSSAVLKGVLQEDYYQHHLLLVESTYLLLQRCISEKDVHHSSELLKHYCFLFAFLYGEQHMTINVHNLLHLPDVVRRLGPLWAHSCFPFENANGELLKLFHGSQAVEKQVIRHISEHHKIPSFAKRALHPGSKQEELFKSMNHSERKCHTVSKKNVLSGKPYYGALSENEITSLEKIGITTNRNYEKIKFYPYLQLQNNSILSAQSKSKVTKRNNCCLAYIDGEGHQQKGICDKLFIIEVNDKIEEFCLIKKLTLSSNQLCKDTTTHAQLHHHLAAYIPPSVSQQEVVLCNAFIEKCILMDLTSDFGLVFVSNIIETDY